MRQLSLTLLMVAACGAPARAPTLIAPPSATWTSAEIQTGNQEVTYEQSYIGGERTIELPLVRLIIRRGDSSQSVALVEFLVNKFDSSVAASSHFELASSPDGRWIAVTANRGATWVLVDPDALVACPLETRGRIAWSDVRCAPPAR